MTNRLYKALDFETEFVEWEKNRMYPPNHEREPMITMTDQHLKALARAVIFINSGVTKSLSEKHKRLINEDLSLIDQVHKYVRQQINEPGLCMNPDVPKIELGDKNHGPENRSTAD